MFRFLTASVIAVLSVFTPTFASSEILETQFANFVSSHEKSYESSEEYYTRMNIFANNVKYINKHNAGNHSFTLAINQFADLTNKEFKARFVPMKHQQSRSSIDNLLISTNVTLPASLDWRVASGNPKNLVAVTAVKNQFSCGSCWSFSASGATEGAWAISGKGLVSLSEQELVDCSGSYGNNGCGGGDMDAAFKYIHDHGLCTEASYPYKATDGSCKKCTAVAHLNGYTDISNEAGIINELQKGPVSIGIEADQAVFQFYNGGVLDDTGCGTQLDHGVLIVGYGTDNGKDYWIVKNSWGADWGENGYVRIARGKGMCGIGQMQSRPYYTNQLTNLEFNWSLLWDCVDHCGAGIIKDIIECSGDLAHIWDILKCVGDIVGTVSPCYKCIKGILG